MLLEFQNGCRPEESDLEGNTPLHLAAEAGDATLVGLLLDQDLELDCANKDGWTPLHLVGPCVCLCLHLVSVSSMCMCVWCKDPHATCNVGTWHVTRHAMTSESCRLPCSLMV